MPDKVGRFNGQEKAFVEAYGTTGDREYARFRANYRSTASAVQALQRPAIQAEIRKVQLERLHNDLLPAAVTVLRTALDLDYAGVPWGSRITAAKIVTDRVFNDAQSAASKDMADMTADELKERMAQLQNRLADIAKPVLDHVDDAPEAGAFE